MSASSRPRRGTGLGALRLAFEWQASRLRPVLPLTVSVQALLAVGIVIGFGFLVGDDVESARFLATGAPTILLAVVGFVLLPQQLVRSKLEGSFILVKAFPVGPFVFLLADTVVWVLASLPGVVFAAVIAAAVHGPTAPSVWVAPAVALAALTFTAIGYAVAVLAKPMSAMIYTQVLMIGTVMLSPVLFPLERVPLWFARMHWALPVQPIAELVRGTLAPEFFSVGPSTIARAAVWFCVALALSAIGITQRT